MGGSAELVSRVGRQRISDWQRRVLTDLAAITEAFPDQVVLPDGHRLEKGSLVFRLRLHTADISRVQGGLSLGVQEEFLITVARSDMWPPFVDVDHLRFLHHAHVLQGQRLCLYLDPSREWDPAAGIGGVLDRLVEWLSDAAGGRFDAQTALYHAVGGVLHAKEGAPTIVVRQSPRARRRAQHGWLVRRGPHRFDLTLQRPATQQSAAHVPVLTLDMDLPLGAGNSLRSLIAIVDNPYFGHPPPGGAIRTGQVHTGVSETLLTVLGASAIRKADGTPQAIVIAVPHPTGGPPHLLAGNIPASGADHLRELVKAGRDRSAMINIDRDALDPETPLEWWPVSDERREVTTRRDSTRPVAAFSDRTVHLWGCGGLGSWVAEYVVRAGVRKISLCDPGRITGGLLVRQNYVEGDVGNLKAEALAERLRAINDTVEVSVYDPYAPTVPDLAEVDLIIDATVSVAVGRVLDSVAAAPERPVIAQLATDPRTGTLGIMTVSMPPVTAGPLTIDRRAGQKVRNTGSLEAFHHLWRSPETGEDVIPTRGCSTPTFHGSAADMAGVAGSLTSILGAHLGSTTAVSGTHLISLPHGEAGPLRAFVPAQEPGGAQLLPEDAA